MLIFSDNLEYHFFRPSQHVQKIFETQPSLLCNISPYFVIFVKLYLHIFVLVNSYYFILFIFCYICETIFAHICPREFTHIFTHTIPLYLDSYFRIIWDILHSCIYFFRIRPFVFLYPYLGKSKPIPIFVISPTYISREINRICA